MIGTKKDNLGEQNLPQHRSKQRRLAPLLMFPYGPIPGMVQDTTTVNKSGSFATIQEKEHEQRDIANDSITTIPLPIQAIDGNHRDLFPKPRDLLCKQVITGHAPVHPLQKNIYSIDLHSSLPLLEFVSTTRKRCKRNPWKKGEYIVKSVTDVSKLNLGQAKGNMTLVADVMTCSFVAPGDRLLLIQDKYQHANGLQILGAQMDNITTKLENLQRPIRLFLERKPTNAEIQSLTHSKLRYGPGKLDFRVKGAYFLENLVGRIVESTMPPLEGRVPPITHSFIAVPKNIITENVGALQTAAQISSGPVFGENKAEMQVISDRVQLLMHQKKWPSKQSEIDQMISLIAMVDVSPESQSYFIDDHHLCWHGSFPLLLPVLRSAHDRPKLRVRLFLAGSPEHQRSLWVFLFGSFHAGKDPQRRSQAYARLTDTLFKSIFEYAGYNTGYTFAGTMKFVGRAYIKRLVRNSVQTMNTESAVFRMCRPGIIFNEAFKKQINCQKKDNLIQISSRDQDVHKVLLRKPVSPYYGQLP